MAAYTTGTAKVTAGSSKVFGVLTEWGQYTAVGDLFKVNSESVFYEIAAINSATQLTLTSRYANTLYEAAVATNLASITTATKQYSGNFAKTPVIQNKVVVVASPNAGGERFTDNGAGVLVGEASPAGSGTIDYDSGAWTITLGTPVTATLNLTASYNYGTAGAGISYSIISDFTPNHYIPEMSTNDINFPHIYTKAMRVIDVALAVGSFNKLSASVVTASHFHGLVTATFNKLNASVITASHFRSTVSATFNNLSASDITASKATIGNIVIPTVYTNEKNPNGFIDHSTVTVSFVNASRLLKVTPTSGSFDYYIKGVLHTITGPATKGITDTEGLHYVYFKDDETMGVEDSFNASLLNEVALAGIVYWDKTNSKQIYLGEETHELMDWRVHEYAHRTRGFVLESGGALGDFDADNAAPDNASAQFSNELSVGWDEDIRHSLAARGSTDNISLYYRDGLDASSLWRVKEDDSFAVKHDGSGLAQYNQLSGGSWSTTDVTSGRYVLSHVFVFNDETRRFGAIMGQSTYTTIAAARDGAVSELGDIILAGVPTGEFKFLGTVIFQTANAYTNTPKSRIRTIDGGTTNYVDWRTALVPVGGGGTVVTDHGSLAGLTDPDHPASAIYTDTTNFAGILSGTDTLVQTALDTIDDHLHVAQTLTNDGITPDSGTLTITGVCAVTGNITTTGTVDGVDIAAFKSSYDAHVHVGETLTNDGITPDSGLLAVIGGFTVTDTSSVRYAAHFYQNNATNSFGVLIDAGLDADDYALRVRDKATTSELFFVRGDGAVSIGTGSLTIGSIAAGASDYDKFLVSDSGLVKYRTGAQVLSDIGGATSAHVHTGDTLENDGITPDSGTLSITGVCAVTGNITTTGTVDGVDIAAFKSSYDAHVHVGETLTNDGITPDSGTLTITGVCAVTGNITTTGTVDGVDIAAFKSSYDAHVHVGETLTNDGITPDSGTLTITGVCAVTGNITTTGTVDGVDIAAFKSSYDAHVHVGETLTNDGITPDSGTLTVAGRVVASTGLLDVGVNGGTAGTITVYGDGASSDEGGDIFFYTAADYDTTIDWFGLQAYQDDFLIGPSSDVDSLKYDGATGYWNFTGGLVNIGVDDTLQGSLRVFGHAAGSTAGGIIQVYTAADYDGTIVSYQFKATSDDLNIGPNTNPDSLLYANTGYWAFTEGIVYVGVSDTQYGRMLIMGHAAGSDDGGEIDLYTAADHDGTIQNYTVKVTQDDLHIGPSNNSDSLIHTGADGYWKFTEGKLDLGTDDTTAGTLRVFGQGAGSTEGGDIFLFTAADHDGTISNYSIQVVADDLTIGPSTDTDALKYDGGTNKWNLSKPVQVTDGTSGWTYTAVKTTTASTLISVTGSIPSWATEVEVFFNGVSTNLTSQPPILRVGTSGGLASSTYYSVVCNISSTVANESGYSDGFYPHRSTSFSSGESLNGVLTLKRWDKDAYKWFAESKSIQATAEINTMSGWKELDNELTQLAITTPGGSATFDAGSIRVRYR